MSVSVASVFGSVTSMAGWWATGVVGQPSFSAEVFEVPVALRNVFPAGNFNRDVTTTWWETEVLDGHSTAQYDNVKEGLKGASYIVLDRAMYDVRAPIWSRNLSRSC